MSQRVTTSAPIPISLENLAANPDFFIGATLQLTGQYKRLPRLACDGDTFPSPATWGLVDGDYLANAAGMDRQLRSLVDEGQMLTVEGQWLKFQGPIGCGASALDEDVWYISVSRVLDPYPLVRSAGTANAGEPVTTAVAALSPTETILSDNGPNDVAPTVTVTAQIPTAAIESTPTGTLVPTIDVSPTSAELGASSSPTAAAPVPGTPTSPAVGTATVGASGSPTNTPVAAGTQSTATATPVVSTTPTISGAVVERGALNTEDLTIRNLAAGSIDRWTLDLQAGEMITITVAPAQAANLVLSLTDSNGTALVDSQDNSAAGEVETFRNIAITDPGVHSLRITADPAVATDYALMFMDSESYSFVFRGRLTELARTDSLPVDTDHFWFFVAESGDTIAFQVIPSDSGDPYLELYDPGGARMLTIDDTGEGETESLDNYTLPEGGLYAIRVAEFDFQAMSYQIQLTGG